MLELIGTIIVWLFAVVFLGIFLFLVAMEASR